MPKILRQATAYSKLAICQYLTGANRFQSSDLSQAAAIAAMRGHLDVLQYFLDWHKVNLHEMQEEIIQHAVRTGHFDIRHEMQQRGYTYDVDSGELLNFAIGYDNLALVKGILERRQQHQNLADLACVAAAYTSVQTMRFILKTYRLPDDENRLFDIWFYVLKLRFRNVATFYRAWLFASNPNI